MIDRVQTDDVPATLREGVDRAVVQARRDVIERHRRLGVSLAVRRDGRVVLLDPRGVPLPNVSPPSGPNDDEAARG